MAEVPQASYAAALAELRQIRDRLVAGHTDPRTSSAWRGSAAAAGAAARAALRRAGDAVDQLGASLVGPPKGAAGDG